MTDEKRIEEIRARLAAYERGQLGYTPYALDVGMVLDAYDAERARAVRAEAERDARPAITPRMAAGWLVERFDADGPSANWNDVVALLRAHAAKVRTSPARCEVCDWPLHDTIDKGCTAESCSYRPEFGSEEHRRIAARRKEIAEKAGGGT